MSIIEFDRMLLDNADFLRPFAITLTHDKDEAKDLLQETMFRALANREKYSVGTNVKAWLYTIMRNIFINNYRRKRRYATVFDNQSGDSLLDLHSAPAAYDVESRIRLKEIRRVIEALPGIFKKPFLLYYDGYKYNEIAIMLAEPLGTIKSRIHFARKLLKLYLERN